MAIGTRAKNRDFHTGTIRKLAVSLALAVGMGVVGLAASGTAAAYGMALSASRPAILDTDGTHGYWRPAIQGAVDSDGFQAAKP
jgi:hypothetical protein